MYSTYKKIKKPNLSAYEDVLVVRQERDFFILNSEKIICDWS